MTHHDHIEIGSIANRLATTLVVDKEFREICRTGAILLRQMSQLCKEIDELNTEIDTMHELIKSLKEF